jgi:protein-S-isoprenylcysteine O-methyltransferase Ste14
MTGEVVARFIRAHLYGAGVIGLFVVLPAFVLPRLDARLPLIMPDLLRYPGLLILLAGAALSYTSFWFFITKGRGTAFPTEPPKEMIIRGPYCYVRNPMYVGNLAIIFGEALLFRSPMLLLYAIAMCFVTHLYVTRSEEPVLKRRYGEPYLNYVRTTPRWLP